ncbi:SET domain-containing protein [Thozetella sp. PMI_491]|nr:SET domain-containing protein [Thozetella sp. PMI_491]
MLLAVALLLLAQRALGADQCGWNPRSLWPLERKTACPPLLDEHAGDNPGGWTPWTHPPYCAGSSFCVYTNAMIPRRDGISIITTPEIAATSMSLFEHIFDLPFANRSKTYDGNLYELRDVPGKGKGAIATRRIARDMVIMIDPAIMMATVEYPADVQREQVQDILQRGAEQLRDPNRVLGLAQKGTPGASVVEDVLITNSFGVSVDGNSYMGLFPELSRFNHACHPNAFIHFSETTMAVTMWASHNIEPGEEITISYLDFGSPYPERQEMLRDVWGFECKCAMCSAPVEEREASDERRNKVRALHSEITRILNQGEFLEAVKVNEELLRVVDEEDLMSHYGEYFEIPAQLYNAVGDYEKAEKFTRMVLHELQGYGTPGEVDKVKIQKFTKLLSKIQEKRKRKRRQDGH